MTVLSTAEAATDRKNIHHFSLGEIFQSEAYVKAWQACVDGAGTDRLFLLFQSIISETDMMVDVCKGGLDHLI